VIRARSRWCCCSPVSSGMSGGHGARDSQRRARRALTLAEVLAVLAATHPQLEAARQRQRAAEGDAMAARGGFDPVCARAGSTRRSARSRGAPSTSSCASRRRCGASACTAAGGWGSAASRSTTCAARRPRRRAAGRRLACRCGRAGRSIAAAPTCGSPRSGARRGGGGRRRPGDRARAGGRARLLGVGRRRPAPRGAAQPARPRRGPRRRAAQADRRGQRAGGRGPRQPPGDPRPRARIVAAERALQQAAFELARHLRDADGELSSPSARALPSAFPEPQRPTREARATIRTRSSAGPTCGG
jgi:hypothetical protein